MITSGKRGVNRFCRGTGCAVTIPAILMGLVFTLGCGGAKVIDVEVDPTFDYSQAASGEIGIAGFAVTVGDENHRAELERQLPPLLAQSLSQKRPRLIILAPKRIEQALGEENHRSLIDQYALGPLGQEGMAQLFDATRGMVRYVILGRVEMDEIVKTMVREEDSTSSGKRYKTNRGMAVLLEIYDLESGRSVFSGLIANDKTNDRYVPDLVVETDSWADACGSVFISCLESGLWDLFQKEPEDDGYPSPPTTGELAREIFDEFAEQLPSADES